MTSCESCGRTLERPSFIDYSFCSNCESFRAEKTRPYCVRKEIFLRNPDRIIACSLIEKMIITPEEVDA